jgi:hypothetical protein
MSLFKSFFAREPSPDEASSPLSAFIRSPSAKRKKVYTKVLKRASESQNEVIARAAKKRARPQASE